MNSPLQGLSRGDGGEQYTALWNAVARRVAFAAGMFAPHYGAMLSLLFVVFFIRLQTFFKVIMALLGHIFMALTLFEGGGVTSSPSEAFARGIHEGHVAAWAVTSACIMVLVLHI